MPPSPQAGISRASAYSDTLETKEQCGPTANIEGEDEQVLNANFVTWSGVGDVENPKNWAQSRKWLATLLMSCISLMTLMSSAMIAPALSNIAGDLSIDSSIETQLTLSSFVLAYAFAPMFIGPLSEVFGRTGVLQACNSWFLIWTLVCGFAHTEALMVVARLFSGIGGGAIFAIGDGFLGDCWKPSERGKSFAIYNAVPLLGPALGPLVGGYMAATIGWRWIFWVVAIFDAVILSLSLYFLRETHARTILYHRMQKIRTSTGNDQLYSTWDSVNDKERTRSARTVIVISFTRAFQMLGTQPILQVVALYQAFNYGVMFLMFSTFATVWTDTYHQTESRGGLNYLSIVLGSGFASLLGGPINDRIWAYLSRKHKREDGSGVPEYRVPLMIPGVFLVPTGLLWYGWSAQVRLHWIMPNIGVIVFMIGITSSGQCMSAYVIDAYAERTASAMAAVTFLRSIMGFTFPLFAPDMYQKLGYGWGNSLLAFLAVLIGLPVPALLWVYGPALRQRSGCK